MGLEGINAATFLFVYIWRGGGWRWGWRSNKANPIWHYQLIHKIFFKLAGKRGWADNRFLSSKGWGWRSMIGYIMCFGSGYLAIGIACVSRMHVKRFRGALSINPFHMHPSSIISYPPNFTSSIMTRDHFPENLFSLESG